MRIQQDGMGESHRLRYGGLVMVVDEVGMDEGYVRKLRVRLEEGEQ